MRKRLKGAEPAGGPPADNGIFRQVWRIAWPASLESFLIALASFVDSRMVSRVDPTALAQVNITGEPRLVCAAFFTGIGIGVSALVARRKGEGSRERANRVFKAGLAACLVLTVLLSLISVLFADGIIRFAGSRPETHEGAAGYFRIVMGFFCFTSFSTVINAGLRGSGDSRTALWANLACNGVNLLSDWLLIDGKFGLPALGVKGAAVGLVIGTAVGLAISVASLLRRSCYLSLKGRENAADVKAEALPLWRLSRQVVLEQVIIEGGILLFQKVIASRGTYAFTAHSIGMKVLNLSFSFGSGLASAAVALVGFALGEKRKDLARAYGTVCQRIGMAVAAVLGCCYLFFGREIVSFLSGDPGVIRDARNLLYILIVLLPLQITQLVYGGCLRGCGDTKFCTRLSLFTFGVLRPGLAYIAVVLLDLGLYGAWCCLIVDQIVRVVLTGARFYGGKWEKVEV